MNAYKVELVRRTAVAKIRQTLRVYVLARTPKDAADTVMEHVDQQLSDESERYVAYAASVETILVTRLDDDGIWGFESGHLSEADFHQECSHPAVTVLAP